MTRRTYHLGDHPGEPPTVKEMRHSMLDNRETEGGDKEISFSFFFRTANEFEG